MQRRHPVRFSVVTVGLAMTLAASTAIGAADAAGRLSRSAQFERIATFEVIGNEAGAARTDERVAEILAASEDGLTLIYVDSVGGNLGFLDISDPANPAGLGVVPVPGEPTSVAVAGPYALVAVNTSADFVNVDGDLLVFDIASRTLIRTLPLGGQPDSVAVSPDQRFAAVVIENERDEDKEDPSQTPEEGGLPQLPAGALVIVDLNGAPAAWTTRTVDLTGLADFAPEDPEPEFVDINTQNIATVTLQENNHIVLVNLRTGKVIRDFTAGTVDLTDIDTIDAPRPNLIALTDSLNDVPREPDAITWINNQVMATANEGDLFGGSRGFTLFGLFGQVRFDAGSDFEHLAVRHGHYQDRRSDAKGSEPEGIKAATFNGRRMLFVGAERAGFVAVYRLRTPVSPEFVQILPTGIGPEGLLAIPQRNLFAVASEVDLPPEEADELAGFRSVISLYELRNGVASYPTIVSADRPDTDAVGAGLPIPWGALSALAADREDADTVYTAHDSFYQQSRLYSVDVGQTPAVITGETVLRTAGGATVNYDVEGVVQRPGGGFWLVSEGAGSAPSPSRLNLLIEVAADGTIAREIRLPAEVEALQVGSGFEGVAVTGSGDAEKVYVAFQREWTGDPAGQVRIGEYTPADDSWRFFYYPLDAKNPVLSNAWVGLSELVALDDQTFAVIERDNLIGNEAQIKRLYTFSIAGLTPQPQGGVFPVVSKTLARDILPDLKAPNGSVLDKPEGLTVAADGQVYLVTDNDGVDDSPGETQFLRLGESDDVFPPAPPPGIDN